MNVSAWCVVGKEGDCMCQAAHVVKTFLWSHSSSSTFMWALVMNPGHKACAAVPLSAESSGQPEFSFQVKLNPGVVVCAFNPTSLPISTSPPHFRFSEVYIVNSPFVSKVTLYGILSPFHKALFYAFSICFQINQMLFSFPFFSINFQDIIYVILLLLFNVFFFLSGYLKRDVGELR